MSARIRLPDGRVADREFSFSRNEASLSGGFRLHLYFSEGMDFLLADYLELPFLKVVEIEKVSRMDGISIQIQLEDGASLFPKFFYFHSPDNGELPGSISAGLFNWFWNLQIQGPLPKGPFRLSVQFA